MSSSPARGSAALRCNARAYQTQVPGLPEDLSTSDSTTAGAPRHDHSSSHAIAVSSSSLIGPSSISVTAPTPRYLRPACSSAPIGREAAVDPASTTSTRHSARSRISRSSASKPSSSLFCRSSTMRTSGTCSLTRASRSASARSPSARVSPVVVDLACRTAPPHRETWRTAPPRAAGSSARWAHAGRSSPPRSGRRAGCRRRAGAASPPMSTGPQRRRPSCRRALGPETPR